MTLLGSRRDFEVDHGPRRRICHECDRTIEAGAVAFVSRNRRGKIVKVVCSDECREAFDDRVWQQIADRREARSESSVPVPDHLSVLRKGEER